MHRLRPSLVKRVKIKTGAIPEKYIGLTLRASPAGWLPVAANLALLDTAMEELLSLPDVWIPELRFAIA